MATPKDVKDSKDVNVNVKSQSKGIVLSKSMQGVTAAPKPRTRKVIIEDYVEVDGEEEQCVESGQGDIQARQKIVEAPKGNSLLAKMAVTDPELRQFLLREIAATRGGRHEGTLAEHKHLYTVSQANFAAAGTEVPIAAAHVAGGTTVSTRLTNTIVLLRLRIKVFLRRANSGAATTLGIDPPAIHMALVRDKTPTTPGTAFTLHGTDANPPASATLMFSRLGAAQSLSTDRTMVRNPITEDLYHLYDYKRHVFKNLQLFNTTTASSVPNETETYDFSFDMNQVKQVYVDATLNPITNDVWFVMWTDTIAAADTTTQSYRVVTDLEFADVQDDE